MRSRNKTDKRGMTLVELLVTMTILSVISAAIYASLNSGLKIWKRVNQQLVHEDMDIFFDRFRHDLKNCTSFGGIAFAGTPERVEFAALFPSPGWGADTVGRISYLYDPQTKTLARIQQDFSQIYTGEDTAKIQAIPKLEAAKFRYYIYDKETKEYSWQDDFVGGDLPVAVRIELESGDGPQAQRFVRTVDIPAAG